MPFYPGGMFGSSRRVIRWNIRVTAYTLILVTDWYPRSGWPLGSATRASRGAMSTRLFGPCWRGAGGSEASFCLTSLSGTGLVAVARR